LNLGELIGRLRREMHSCNLKCVHKRQVFLRMAQWGLKDLRCVAARGLRLKASQEISIIYEKKMHRRQNSHTCKRFAVQDDWDGRAILQQLTPYTKAARLSVENSSDTRSEITVHSGPKLGDASRVTQQICDLLPAKATNGTCRGQIEDRWIIYTKSPNKCCVIILARQTLSEGLSKNSLYRKRNYFQSRSYQSLHFSSVKVFHHEGGRLFVFLWSNLVGLISGAESRGLGA